MRRRGTGCLKRCPACAYARAHQRHRATAAALPLSNLPHCHCHRAVGHRSHPVVRPFCRSSFSVVLARLAGMGMMLRAPYCSSSPVAPLLLLIIGVAGSASLPPNTVILQDFRAAAGRQNNMTEQHEEIEIVTTDEFVSLARAAAPIRK